MPKLLTEKQRHKGSAVVLVLGLSSLPMSLSLLVVTVYIRFVVDEELELVQGMETATLPYFLAVTGTINFMSNLLLLSVMARVHKPSSRDAAAVKLLFVAIVIDLIATGLLFSACLFCLIQMAMLPSSFKAGLQQALRQYSSVGHVKVRLDILQMEYQCCGDNGYQDWFQVPWVPQDILVVDPKEAQAHIIGAQYTNDDVPFSCCDPSSPRPCIHHHVTTDHLHYNYDHRVNTTLHTAGCRQALMDFFGHTLLKHLALDLLFLVLLQLFYLSVSRLLQTSMRRAMKIGDHRASSAGYIFKRPKGKGPKKDEEMGRERRPLMQGRTPGPGGKEKPSEGGDQQTTDTEGDTTEEPASEEGEQPSPFLTTDSELEYAPSTEEDHIYENIPPEGLYENIPPEELYENIPSEELYEIPSEELYDDIDVGFSGKGEKEEKMGHPLFPSEMAKNRAYSNSTNCARQRGSKAFNSLGIIPPQDLPMTPGYVHHQHHPDQRSSRYSFTYC